MRNRVLVVDDEADICELVAAALLRSGFSVATAGSAEAALDLIERRSFDVMFFDLNLPNMNGTDLCREVRKVHPVPVIFAITGHGRLFELAECRSAGFDDYFLKPTDLSVLIDAAHNGAERVSRWTRARNSHRAAH
jgi:DNA-binding response OmpR family regulator